MKKAIVCKNASKIIIFLLVVCFLINKINHVMVPDIAYSVEVFQMQKNNTIEVLSFGNSHNNCTFNNALLWDEYGIASYNYSIPASSIISAYYGLKECVKTQKPQVVLLETASCGMNFEYSEEELQRGTNALNFSKNYMEFIMQGCKALGKNVEETLNYLVKTPVIHNRYTELGKIDFMREKPYQIGYNGSKEHEYFEIPEASQENGVIELKSIHERYLYKIINYCNKNNIPLVLWAAPYVLTMEEQQRFNAVEKIATELDIPFYNFNKLDVMQDSGFDYAEDMREFSHVNDLGANKVTQYLYKKELSKYDLGSHWNEGDYDNWRNHSRYVQDKQLGNLWQDEMKLDEFLNGISLEKDVAIVLSGGYKAQGDWYLESLKRLEMTEAQYESGGCFIYDSGTRSWISLLEEKNRYYISSCGTEWVAYPTILEETGETKLQIYKNSELLPCCENGVYIQCFDDVLDYIICSGNCDIYQGDEVNLIVL